MSLFCSKNVRNCCESFQSPISHKHLWTIFLSSSENLSKPCFLANRLNISVSSGLVPSMSGEPSVVIPIIFQ